MTQGKIFGGGIYIVFYNLVKVMWKKYVSNHFLKDYIILKTGHKELVSNLKQSIYGWNRRVCASKTSSTRFKILI